jgi:Cu/Ag efflux pump CusA
MVAGSKRADEEAAMTDLRADLERLPGVQYKFSRPTLFSFKTPVEVEVVGYDLDKLKAVSNEIARHLSTSPRFADVKSTMEIGHPEIQIVFDRERAAALGLAVHQIADRVVDKVRGDVATRYSYHDRKIDVLVRAREEDRNSVERVRKLIINPESERPVPLEAVATSLSTPAPVKSVVSARSVSRWFRQICAPVISAARRKKSPRSSAKFPCRRDSPRVWPDKTKRWPFHFALCNLPYCSPCFWFIW